MCSPLCPLHALLFYKAFADHLIDRRFHKRGADGLAVPIAFAEVRNVGPIIINVSVEFMGSFQQFPGCVVGLFDVLYIAFQVFNDLQSLKDVAMPQVMFDAFQCFLRLTASAAFFSFTPLAYCPSTVRRMVI